MRALLTSTLTLLPGVGLAHPGHLAEVAGHDHVIAGVAIGLAIGVAIWGALKGRHDNEVEVEEEADEAASDDELQDA